ncbi:MAG: histone deacetylase [Chloroflexus sp.]
MTTAIVTDQRFDLHTWHGHVEQAGRLHAIQHALQTSGLLPRLATLPIRPATEAELLAVHSPPMLHRVRQLASYGGGQIDSDTYVTADSWEVGLLAAGATICLVEAIATGQCDNGFALVRPPGHHATDIRSMGFCLFNNIAVAARVLLDQHNYQRIAIIDFDVHHGNGTQDIFYSDGRVFFCSTHAAPLYPGTGAIHETGDPRTALGTTLNIPLPYGTGDQGYDRVFRHIIGPALRWFQPEIILVSAGFDAHWSDPIGPMSLSVKGFASIGQHLLAWADELCDGRIGFVLEGGYSLPALAAGVVAIIRLLLGLDPGPDPLGSSNTPEPSIEHIIRTVHNQHPLFIQTGYQGEA